MAEVKRGYRKVTMVIPAKVYDQLTKLAEVNLRDVGQQAAYYVQQALIEVEAYSIKEAYNGAVDAREDANLDAAAARGRGTLSVELPEEATVE